MQSGKQIKPRNAEIKCGRTTTTAVLPFYIFALPIFNLIHINNKSEPLTDWSEVRIILRWWTIKDSNLGPTGYEPVALTN